MLLHFGADTDVKNFEGQSPQDIIKDGNEASNDMRNGKGSDSDIINKLFNQSWHVGNIKHIPKTPIDEPKCLKNEVETCKDFTAYVRYYWRGQGISRPTSTSVYGLVYGEELKNIEKSFKEYLSYFEPNTYTEFPNPTTEGVSHQDDQESVNNEKRNVHSDSDTWRWIHLPVNNISTSKSRHFGFSANA